MKRLFPNDLVVLIKLHDFVPFQQLMVKKSSMQERPHVRVSQTSNDADDRELSESNVSSVKVARIAPAAKGSSTWLHPATFGSKTPSVLGRLRWVSLMCTDMLWRQGPHL